MSRDEASTSLSMLERVRHHDAVAWEMCCRIYGPLVYRWARMAGLQDCDAADIGQDVFRTVFGKIREYDGLRAGASFRGWLRTITRNKIGDFLRRQAGQPAAAGGTTAWQLREQVPDEISDADHPLPNEEREVLFRTLELLKGDFQPVTWQAFWLSTIEDVSAAEIAERLGMSLTAVRQAKFRVLRRLRDEMGAAPGYAPADVNALNQMR